MITKLIGGFIVLTIGFSLLPAVANEIKKPKNKEIEIPIKEKNSPSRQTYEEYVKERLRVEMMMKKGKPINEKIKLKNNNLSIGLRNAGMI